MATKQSSLPVAAGHVPAQVTYNLLVESFCQSQFLIRYRVPAFQIEHLRRTLLRQWQNRSFRDWVQTYSRQGQSLNVRRVLMVFGHVMSHTYYFAKVPKTQMARHLFLGCADVLPYRKIHTLENILKKPVPPIVEDMISL